jgi:predicted O-methyltransferase YrrM
MTSLIGQRILFEDYLRDMPLLHSWDGGITWNAGGFGRDDLEKLYHFLQGRLPAAPIILETGAGNSTIMMLFLSPAKLITIAPDAKLFERIRHFCQNNGISHGALEEHVDGSQWVLPRLAEDNRFADPILDFALIDGSHGWPTCFVDLEYTNSLLKQGGYLWIDDIQLHAVKEMARFLAEQPNFTLVLDMRKSLVFRKLSAERHLGDWVGQPYIVRRSTDYSQFPNPFALHEFRGPRLSWIAYRARRLPQTIRKRLRMMR